MSDEFDFSGLNVKFTDDAGGAVPMYPCEGGATSIGCAAMFCGENSCYNGCTNTCYASWSSCW